MDADCLAALLQGMKSRVCIFSVGVGDQLLAVPEISELCAGFQQSTASTAISYPARTAWI